MCPKFKQYFGDIPNPEKGSAPSHTLYPVFFAPAKKNRNATSTSYL